VIFARGVTTFVATTARKDVGGSVGGFVALLNAVGSIALFGFLFILARGFTASTMLGPLLSVPVILPLGLLAAGLVLLWLLRATGWKGVGGRLVHDDVPDDFTGRATETWWRLTSNPREWTLLSRTQPAVGVMLGVALCLLPWTRAIGVFLLVAAAFASWRTTAERRAALAEEMQRRAADPYAKLMAPVAGVASPPSSKAQLCTLDEQLRALLDPQSRADLELNRDAILAAGMPAPVPTPRPLARERLLRGARPTVRYSKASRNLLIVSALVGLNLVAGDPVGMYRHMPNGLTGFVEAVDQDLGVIRSGTELGPGELTRQFLTEVDPAELRRRDAQAREEAWRMLRERLDAFNEVLVAERTTARSQLGVEYHPDAGTPEFDAMLFEDADALEVWTRALNAVAAITADRDEAARFADGIGEHTTAAETERTKQTIESLFKRLADVEKDRATLHAKLTARSGGKP
jgi:hypothetical protein